MILLRTLLLHLAVFLSSVAKCQSQRLQCSNFAKWHGTRTSTNNDKVTELRNAMMRYVTQKGPNIEALIITPFDEHQTEFIDERDKRLKYLSGYSGPGGIAVVTKSKAALWVDAAYYWLADREVDCDWFILTNDNPKNATVTEWIRNVVKTGARIGADPKLVPASLWDEWRRELEINHIALMDVPTNFVDEIWVSRPNATKPIKLISVEEQAGLKRKAKIDMLRQNFSRFDCEAIIVTALDEIAWILNIRAESPLHPFVQSYLFLTKDEIFWYVPLEMVDINFRLEINKDIALKYRNYDEIWRDLRVQSQSLRRTLIPSQCEFSFGASQAINMQIPVGKRLFRPSPVIFLKAKKTEQELKGMQTANLHDSAAFIEFLAWLDDQMGNRLSNESLYEADLMAKLEKFGSNYTHCKGPAFPWVVAYGSRTHLQGYSGSNEIGRDGLLIVHSGNHYLEGTSSIARTFHFGTPRQDEIRAYTLALIGLVHLMNQKFPSSTQTSELDIIARAPLWSSGVHSDLLIGHGIGVYSNFYESPISIEYNSKKSRQVLQANYTLTIGPKYIQPKMFGVHLENTVSVVEKQSFLGFKPLTLVPFEKKLIDVVLLSPQEVDIINRYHTNVLQTVGPKLKQQLRIKALDWLSEKTKAIRPYCSQGSLLLAEGSLIVGLFYLVLLTFFH